MSGHTLSLFGGFDLRDDQGAPIALRSKKGKCLLAYLALHQGRQIQCDVLMEMQWGDRGDSQARHSLSQEFYRLRGLFPEQAQVGFHPADGVVGLAEGLLDVDVARFERGMNAHEPEAAALYTGDLMTGLETGQESYDDWLRIERERLRDRAIVAWHKVVRAQMDGPAEKAIKSASRLLAIDPTSEEAHRALMQLYDKTGRRDLALRQYEKCKEILVRELGIAPDRKTTELHKRIGTTPTDRPLPSKPSIAVLPFNNMSGDADQEHFADALTEDITTELSRYHDLFVISSHSAFSFKGKAGDVRQVARQLGVRYILHGSVRWAEGRVRVSPQLIDAHSGGHVWAERFDGKVEDIFDLQDELTAKTAAAVDSGILAAEIEAAKR